MENVKDEKCQGCGQEKNGFATLEEKLLKMEMVGNLARAAQDITLMEVNNPTTSNRRDSTLHKMFDKIDSLLGEI